MTSPKLPQTDSIQELARFWDAHDLTEFEGELEEVSDPVFVHDTAFTLHLPSTDAEAVRQLARSKGVADEELIRQWVLEKVHAT